MTVYLDHNARSPVRPQAAAQLAETAGLAGNPSSPHAAGRAARGVLESARETLAGLLAAEPHRIIFTSGGTEANALALAQSAPYAALVISAIEHASIAEAARGLSLPLHLAPVDSEGRIKADALAEVLAAIDGRAFVSLMLANNETGVVQDIPALAGCVHEAGGVLHCDAVQAFGKLDLLVETLGADMISLSAHKLGGAPGAGALVLARDMSIRPLLVGGGQEYGRRAGTENLPAIAAFAAAASEAVSQLADFASLARLRDDMEQAVREVFPGARIFSADARRLPNTSCFALPRISAQQGLIMFDLAGVCLSAGAACSSGKIASSPVLEAMGAAEAANGLRMSLGWPSGEADKITFIKALAQLASNTQHYEAAE